VREELGRRWVAPIADFAKIQIARLENLYLVAMDGILRGEIAAIMLTPFRHDAAHDSEMPAAGFLPGVRKLCDEQGMLFILDDVRSGFRLHIGGSGELFGVRPDLTCLGKVVGGGLPAAAYGGRAELMMKIAPEGPVYQAGTLSGNPLAVAAGLETLRQLRRAGVYEQLEACASALVVGLREAADEAGVELIAGSLGGMFGFFFHPGPVRNFEEAKKANAERFRVFFASMLKQGVYLAPSPFEAGFVSLAHRPSDVRKTIAAARVALRVAARVR